MADLKHITALLAKAKSELNPCKQTIIALQIFDYLEHHHHALQSRGEFKEAVQIKAEEFIEEASKRRVILRRLDPNSADYGRAEYLSLLTDALSESCMRVLTMMQWL